MSEPRAHPHPDHGRTPTVTSTSSQRTALIDAFRRGDDIHDQTALKIFGGASGLDRHELRRRAKMINYALLYGKTAFTLSRDIGVPVLWWRSVGSSHTAFSTETFIDEVAVAMGKDPVALRKELLANALAVFFGVRDLPGLKKKPSTSELLDWLKLLVAEDIPLEVLQSRDEKVSVPPLVGALLKNEQDVTLFEKLVFMQRHNR